MIVYYNPDCSKCRDTKDLLEQNHCEFTLRDYLREPPLIDELKELLAKLGCGVRDIVRETEPLYKELLQDKTYSDDEVLAVLSANPILIQRPILVEKDRAIIGRPPTSIVKFIRQ